MPDRIKEASRPLDFLNHRPAGPGHGGDDEQSMATQKSSPEEWRCARNANCNVSATWCVRDLHGRWIAEQGRYAIVPTLLHDTATICPIGSHRRASVIFDLASRRLLQSIRSSRTLIYSYQFHWGQQNLWYEKNVFVPKEFKYINLLKFLKGRCLGIG
jgi:hypothetical protein